MIRKLWPAIAAIVLFGLGLAGGWFAAYRAAPTDDTHQHEHVVVLDPRTLANLGAEVGSVTPQPFVEYRAVLGAIVEPPQNVRPLSAPIAGIVTAVDARPGQAVDAGATIARLLRDAIDRPTLILTSGVLTPVSEHIHENLATLRTARVRQKTLRDELRRVEDVNAQAGDGLPIVPRSTTIELRYDLENVAQTITNAEIELHRHGLEAEQIDQALAGHYSPDYGVIWKHTLRHIDWWSETNDRLAAALPEPVRGRPWSIALIGELQANGLASAALADAMAADPTLARRFSEVAGLLLSGHTLADVKRLAELGALEENVHLRAPNDAETWDIAEVLVRPGQSIDSGQPVAVLRDAREMWLRLAPVGNEVAAVTAALRSGSTFTAQPLVDGNGPALAELRVDRVTATDDGGAAAIAVCRNTPLEGGGEGSRSWQLRAGTRYVARLAVRTLEPCYVLPADALIEDGADKIVLVRSGETFEPKIVRVLHTDHERVAIANDGALTPTDEIVLRAALAVQLALTGGGESDHGHSH